MQSSPTTFAVITTTAERTDSLSRSSDTTEYTELFKIEYQDVSGDDTEDTGTAPMLFKYNNGGYAYLETLPVEGYVDEAARRIEDYILDAQLVDVDIDYRNTHASPE